MANPTIAKDVALYFLGKKFESIPKKEIARQIISAKRLLDANITQEEIMVGIELYHEQMFSIAFIQYKIDEIREAIANAENQRILDEHKQRVLTEPLVFKEVDICESNNRDKLERRNKDARKRKECSLNMLKKS